MTATPDDNGADFEAWTKELADAPVVPTEASLTVDPRELPPALLQKLFGRPFYTWNLNDGEAEVFSPDIVWDAQETGRAFRIEILRVTPHGSEDVMTFELHQEFPHGTVLNIVDGENLEAAVPGKSKTVWDQQGWVVSENTPESVLSQHGLLGTAEVEYFPDHNADPAQEDYPLIATVTKAGTLRHLDVDVSVENQRRYIRFLLGDGEFDEGSSFYYDKGHDELDLYNYDDELVESFTPLSQEEGSADALKHFGEFLGNILSNALGLNHEEGDEEVLDQGGEVKLYDGDFNEPQKLPAHEAANYVFEPTPELLTQIQSGADILQQWVWEVVESKGFHTDRSFGEEIALAHSELSEALEAYRDREFEAWTGEDNKPEGVGSELADTVIRCFDIAHSHDIDLGAEIITKMLFNQTRDWRHGGKNA